MRSSSQLLSKFSRRLLQTSSVLCLCGIASVQAEINLDPNAPAINSHADEVGIWVNSNSDVYRSTLVDQLKALNVKSLRHGWAYGMMSETDPDTFYRSPCDSKVQAYIGYQNNCELKETMPLSDIAQLRADINSKGFAVVPTDLYNYTGTEDAALANMSAQEREALIVANAVRWAEWGKQNGFAYFELGNENDLPGEMVDFGVGEHWSPEAYGQLALAMAKAMREVYPAAKLGINGGWGASAAARTEWWTGIREGAPELLNYLDFVVIHKYEFGSSFDLWSKNLWEWGRVQQDSIQSVSRLFANLPIYITEISGFQVEGGYVPHYRSVMTTEMMGNLLLDRSIEHVQVWGTRWGNDLNFVGDNDALTALGNGMKAYTEFMQPVLFANGTDTSEGSVRYFAARNNEGTKATVWLVNHATEASTQTVSIAGTANIVAQHHLVADNNDPLSRTNRLVETQAGSVSRTANTTTVSANLAPVSVTIMELEFGGSSSGRPAPTPTATPSNIPRATATPAPQPTRAPTAAPTVAPTAAPTPRPTAAPTTTPNTGETEVDLAEYKNVAEGKRAFLSSVLYGGDASKAVDGNRDGVFANGSVTHSACVAGDVLSIDLDSEYPVSSVRLSNRTDCCQEETTDFKLSLKDQGLQTVAEVTQDESIGSAVVYDFAETNARYLEIEMLADNCITLAEVEVFTENSAPVATPTPQPSSTPSPTPTPRPTSTPAPTATPIPAPSATTVSVGVTNLGTDENGNQIIQLSVDEDTAAGSQAPWFVLLLTGGLLFRRRQSKK